MSYGRRMGPNGPKAAILGTTMTFRRQARISAVLAMVACVAAPLDAGQIRPAPPRAGEVAPKPPAEAADVVSRARGLAVAGQWASAVEMLDAYLAGSPGDLDARVLLGTVLSWEGRYDEARKELEAVLRKSPTNDDALLASINVELWSHRPGRAEALARRGLHRHPSDPQYLLAQARALMALNRWTEARDTLERLQAVDPRNARGQQLRRSLQARLRVWEVRMGASYDAFSDHRVAWQEWQASISRTTPVGPIFLSGSHARRFGLNDDQVEVEMYPRLRAGTYLDVAGAYSPHALLYPKYRYAVDLYQDLGAGFEGSAGFRRLGFGPGLNIYVGSLSKYYGPWLFTGRLFVTPKGAGTPETIQASVRRYFGDRGTYVGVQYDRGAGGGELRNRNNLDVLNSEVGGVEAIVVLSGRLEIILHGAYSSEDLVQQGPLRQYSLSTGLGIRF